MKITVVKVIVVAFCVLCASAALGQNAAVLPNTPQPLTIQDHPQHAEAHDMRQESSLLGSNYTSEHGERPLWEFGPVKAVTPLGDLARAQRKEHANDKKSAVMWTN